MNIRSLVITTLLLSVMLMGCQPKEQPESEKAAAATEIPMSVNPLDSVEFKLPMGMTRVRISDTQESFQTSSGTAGGIFLLSCDEGLFEDVENLLSNIEPLVVDGMEAVGVTEPEWRMGGSVEHALYEFSMGRDSAEYIAYFLRGKSTCYVLWFDRTRVDLATETEILESLQSEDITEELNKVTTEDLMAAINKRMEGKTYQFEVNLPADLTSEDTSEDGAVFLRNGVIVGGYKTVHFEEGILPAADENRQLIVDSLMESTKEQLDLTGYEGEMINTSLITIAYRKGGQEYVHYIHYFGQLGTQYDLWFDASEFDETQRLTIFATASVTEIIE